MSIIDLEQLTDSQPSRVFGLSKSHGQPAVFPDIKEKQSCLGGKSENRHLYAVFSSQNFRCSQQSWTENYVQQHCNFYSWPRACDWLWKWEWLTRRNNFGSKHCCHNNFCLTSLYAQCTHIPDICHGRRGRCPCKIFLAGVNFSRCNAKDWPFYCMIWDTL